jgi:hypothetical protein
MTGHPRRLREGHPEALGTVPRALPSVQLFPAGSEYVPDESPFLAREQDMLEREVIERLDRIAVAAEKAAARLWWIALPIYLTVAMLIAWVLLVVLPVLARYRL